VKKVGGGPTLIQSLDYGSRTIQRLPHASGDLLLPCHRRHVRGGRHEFSSVKQPSRDERSLDVVLFCMGSRARNRTPDESADGQRSARRTAQSSRSSMDRYRGGRAGGGLRGLSALGHLGSTSGSLTNRCHGCAAVSQRTPLETSRPYCRLTPVLRPVPDRQNLNNLIAVTVYDDVRSTYQFSRAANLARPSHAGNVAKPSMRSSMA